MASNLEKAASDKIRERGNALYKKGDLIQAEAAYTEAARLDPTDILAFSNISAVKLEMGNNVGCILFIQKALGLLDAQTSIDADQKRQKLYTRLAKAFFYSLQLGEAEEVLSKITSEDSRRELETSLSQTRRLRQSLPKGKALWGQVLDRLPRYRPALYDEPEYFSVGHDDAQTLVGPDLLTNNSDENIACLFCGIGDARNLFATLAFISLSQVSMPDLSAKRFHFTLVDIKATVFARDLLLFRLLFDSATEPKTRRRETLVTLSYVFSAQVMPQWAYDRLQIGLSSVLEDLMKEDVMDIFYIRHNAREQIAQHLKSWRKPPKPWYSAAKLREIASEQTLKSRIKDAATLEGCDPSYPPGCERNSPDALGFAQFTVMLPHMDLLEKHEPVLVKHLTAHARSRLPAAARKVHDYLDSKWQPNVTLVDLDYENKKEIKHTPLMDFEPRSVASALFGNIPVAIAGGASGVLNHICGFFEFIATWIPRIQQQVTVEIVLGEMADTFERLRYGILRQQQDKLGRLDPAVFPNSYDRVHMSNIPDYVGGPLTTFLSGGPILRRARSSEMQSNVLRNTPRWTTLDQFLAEYLLLADRGKIQDHFKVSLSDNFARTEKALSGKLVNGEGCVMAMPCGWTYQGGGSLPWKKLMPRPELERWLVAHFLKLVLPFPRKVRGEDLVFAPLNMTTFFRLVCHAAELGYPAHWLSNLLSDLCDGEITTMARAPRAVVTDPDLAKARYPPRKMCVKPFVAEFKVLFSVWRPLLTLGLRLKHETLPDLKAVREYGVSFPLQDLHLVHHRGNPNFGLVLGHRDVSMEDLRFVLLDDEVGDDSPSAAEARAEPGIHVVSTFKWKTETATATFWFDEAVMDGMRSKGGWEAYIWRTDVWLPVLGPVALEEKGALTVGKSWW